VRPGGTLVYSVCTVTDAETVGVAGSFARDHADLEALPIPGPWRPHGSGGLVLPQDHGTDGMAVFLWRRS
jgi:16S rRNA (cytosine967-C5)-methyltransferase